MSKYIDAEKLISEILKLRSESCISESDDYYEYAKSEIIDIIESLQQKPAEWSKEDSIMLDSILSVIEEWESNQSEKEKEYYGATPKADWLKSLKERILGD